MDTKIIDRLPSGKEFFDTTGYGCHRTCVPRGVTAQTHATELGEGWYPPRIPTHSDRFRWPSLMFPNRLSRTSLSKRRECTVSFSIGAIALTASSRSPRDLTPLNLSRNSNETWRDLECRVQLGRRFRTRPWLRIAAMVRDR